MKSMKDELDDNEVRNLPVDDNEVDDGDMQLDTVPDEVADFGRLGGSLWTDEELFARRASRLEPIWCALTRSRLVLAAVCRLECTPEGQNAGLPSLPPARLRANLATCELRSSNALCHSGGHPPQRLQGKKLFVSPKGTPWAAEIRPQKRAQPHTARGDWRPLPNGRVHRRSE
eukprot:COSAG02_NODE_25786_length_649_cov_0.841818_1_plen_172_part_10